MMSKVVMGEGWKADDYYCVELGQIVGLPWCHFVLGMTEALVDRIHTLNYVSTRRLQLSLQDGRFLDHPLHVPHSDNCVTNERRWRISLLCAWSNQHNLGIFVTVIADLTNLRPESLQLISATEDFSFFFFRNICLLRTKHFVLDSKHCWRWPSYKVTPIYTGTVRCCCL